MLNVWVPLQAPSMNSLLQVLWTQRRLEVRPEVRRFRTQFKTFLPVWSPPDGPLEVRLGFYENWQTKAGTLRVKDMPNLLKAVYDALFERYGLNDARIWQASYSKVLSEQVGIQVYMEAYTGVLTDGGFPTRYSQPPAFRGADVDGPAGSQPTPHPLREQAA